MPCGHRYGQSIFASHGDRLGHRRATRTTCPTPMGRSTSRFIISAVSGWLGMPPWRNAHGIGHGGRRSGGRPDTTPHVPQPWAVGTHRGVKQPLDADTGSAMARATHRSQLGRHVRVARVWCVVVLEVYPSLLTVQAIAWLVFACHHEYHIWPTTSAPPCGGWT